MSQRKLNPFHHSHCQLNVCVYLFPSFALSWRWGMTASLERHRSSLMGSCSIFQGLQDHFRDPWEQAESQHCLFDQLSLPKHLDGAPDKRCSEKELAARPAADEEFKQHREHRGKECIISSTGRDAAKRCPRFEGVLSKYRVNTFTCKGREKRPG